MRHKSLFNNYYRVRNLYEDIYDLGVDEGGGGGGKKGRSSNQE